MSTLLVLFGRKIGNGFKSNKSNLFDSGETIEVQHPRLKFSKVNFYEESYR